MEQHKGQGLCSFKGGASTAELSSFVYMLALEQTTLVFIFVPEAFYERSRVIFHGLLNVIITNF